MTTQYDPNESYNWIFITTNDDTIIKDLTNRNFKKIYDDKKCKTTTYGAKGMSTKKGKNIEVDYKTVTSNDINGNITDKDLNILNKPRDDFKADSTCSSTLTDTDLEELEKLIDDIIKKEGGKRKSRKSKKNKSKKARKYRKTRKSKSHKK
tara:strand:+ start:514 stop:966 length:453 start_codon:yes stop_codon:yes gene_type:complete